MAIFIVPGTTKGTRWELDQINQDETLRKKTFLIIPPQEINLYGLPTTPPLQGNRYGRLATLSRRPYQPRQDALAELAARGISFNGIESSGGWLISYGATSKTTAVPIAIYERSRLERGLLGIPLNLYSKSKGRVMTLGLRNAICTIAPELAAGWSRWILSALRKLLFHSSDADCFIR
jgi:hypothetical protein